MFDLQFYADEAVTGETTEAPVAGETKEKMSFDQLIEGDYRDEYKSRVESIVKQRLKNSAEEKKRLCDLTEMIGELGAKLGLENEGPEQIIAAAMSTKGGEDAEAEETFSQNEEEGRTVPTIDPQTAEKVRELADRVRAATELYPEFDITTELRDPKFAMLLGLTDNDPKKAYEMKYHDLILTNAMHYAVKSAEDRIAKSMASKHVRPNEGAATDYAAVVINTDPKSLTKAQRSEIKKRVRRGEKILW